MSSLAASIKIKVRFSETDAMGVVWHGNYLKFFEDGREEFGEKYKISYLDVFNRGFFTPIVKSEIEHKSPIYYGEEIEIITTYIPSRAAKIIFEYEVKNLSTGKIAATGRTIQVFMDKESREMVFFAPDFYRDWEKQIGIAL